MRMLKFALPLLVFVMLVGFFGVGLMLIWAGFVEAFLSQHHEPAIPYVVKIAFGSIELALLILFLARAGRKARPTADASPT